MSSTEKTQDTTRRRRSPLVVASVAAAVLVAGGGTAYLAAGTGGSGGASGAGDGSPAAEPAPLLALDGAAEGAGPGGGTGGIAPGEPDPNGGDTYRVEGSLPEGPGRAAVHRASGTVSEAEVARLAKALGVDGTPRLVGEVWKAGTEKDGQGPLLEVRRNAPGTWTFARFGPSPGGDDCKKGPSCPADPGRPDADPGSAVSEAVAKKAAAPVLEAAGQDDARLRAGQLMGAVRVVNADPVVGGLPTYGWSTGVQVGADGQVVGGSGHLKEPVRGHSYPVVSAAEAVAALNEEGRGGGVGIGGCASPVPHRDEPGGGGAEPKPDAPEPAEPKPDTPCGTAPEKPGTGRSAPEPMVIEKAVFGLAAQSVDGVRALVPAWLFQVRGEEQGGEPFTVTRTAVEPEYIEETRPPGKDLPPPAEPGEVPPVPGTAYEADGRTLTVHFWGGTCDTYTARATEGPETVKVVITVVDPDPGRVCIALAKEATVKVTLDEPLGDRTVLDGSNGETLRELT